MASYRSVVVHVVCMLCATGVGLATVQAQTELFTKAPAWTETLRTSEPPRGPATGPLLEAIYFPADPPPLGATLPAETAVVPSWAPPILRVFLTEPFFSPLATRLVHLPGEERPWRLGTEESVRLDNFFGLRAALLEEIYREVDRVRAQPAATREAAFQALGRAQAARLTELEDTAEWLRERLARLNPWGEHRTWRLNRDDLRLPRDETYVLEFQLVRAAAFYQPGLSRAQRRLAREVAMEMGETIAAHGRSGAGDALLFFLPETSRILRPRNAPAELEALLLQFQSEKRRARDELRDAIYGADLATFSFTRRRHLDEFSTAQSAALDRLEALAEPIRRAIAGLPEYPRHRGPSRLDPELDARLHAFAERALELQTERGAFIRQRVNNTHVTRAGTPGSREEVAALANAAAAFDVREADRLRAHEREAEELIRDLTAALPLEDTVWLQGRADRALRRYLVRRAEQEAYADYDLAALEPGFSAEQRRVLFASAIGRLHLRIPLPERQPVDAPGTILGLGKTGP